jgi:hypothetical protein
LSSKCKALSSNASTAEEGGRGGGGGRGKKRNHISSGKLTGNFIM